MLFKNKYEKINKYFRLANYITVAQMYLNENNVLLSKKLNEKDLKQYSCGHWGCSPAINFVYANLNYFFKNSDFKLKIVIGTGHAGAALLSNSFIDGTLEKYNKKYQRNYLGLQNLVSSFGKEFRTEINPQYPETIYDGGELGYSLSVAYGYSLNNYGCIIPCIIGDGEAETGTVSSSWQLNKFRNSKKDGLVLPILNLNGYKMGSESLFSKMSNSKIRKYFEALNYKVYIVSKSHNQMQKALNDINFKIKLTKNNFSPIIILKTPKGWTGLNNKDIKIEGNLYSHKNPISLIDNKNKKIEIIEKWLKKYNIKELFIKSSGISLDILDIIKERKNELNAKKIIIPNKIEEINKDFLYSNIYLLNDFLIKLFEKNNLKIFSPDELVSNKLGELMKKDSIKENIIEILNENICQGLLQGYTQNGNFGIMISYEAFMPIIISMVSQYLKYIYQSKQISFRKELHSLNYILTSTCWENNYSHQNPEFVNSILGKEYEFVNAYYPKDSNNLIECLNTCLKTKNCVNIITISKGLNKQYQNLKETNINIEILKDCKKPDLIFCATGDYILSEINNAIKLLNQILPKIKIKLVYVTNIKVLDTPEKYKEALSEKEFNLYFNQNISVIYGFHGYKSLIKSILYDRNRNFTILGYEDKSNINGSVKEKLQINNIGRINFIDLALKELLKVNKIDNDFYKKIKRKIGRGII